MEQLKLLVRPRLENTYNWWKSLAVSFFSRMYKRNNVWRNSVCWNKRHSQQSKVTFVPSLRHYAVVQFSDNIPCKYNWLLISYFDLKKIKIIIEIKTTIQ